MGLRNVPGPWAGTGVEARLGSGQQVPSLGSLSPAQLPFLSFGPDSEPQVSTQERPFHSEEKTGALQALRSALGVQDPRDSAIMS